MMLTRARAKAFPEFKYKQLPQVGRDKDLHRAPRPWQKEHFAEKEKLLAQSNDVADGERQGLASCPRPWQNEHIVAKNEKYPASWNDRVDNTAASSEERQGLASCPQPWQKEHIAKTEKLRAPSNDLAHKENA